MEYVSAANVKAAANAMAMASGSVEIFMRNLKSRTRLGNRKLPLFTATNPQAACLMDKAVYDGQSVNCVIIIPVRRFVHAAVGKHKTTGSTINYPTDVTPYIKLNANGSIPPCPAGGSYTLGTLGAAPQENCSLGNNVTPGHFLP